MLISWLRSTIATVIFRHVRTAILTQSYSNSGLTIVAGGRAPATAKRPCVLAGRTSAARFGRWAGQLVCSGPPASVGMPAPAVLIGRGSRSGAASPDRPQSAVA
jgi:hypothetical protein